MHRAAYMFLECLVVELVNRLRDQWKSVVGLLSSARRHWMFGRLHLLWVMPTHASLSSVHNLF